MQVSSTPRHFNRTSSPAALAVFAMAILAATALDAAAGTDTTFSATTTNLTNYTSGSLGKLAAVGSLAVGIVGAVLRFDWKLIAGAVGIGMAAATGPAIVTGLTTAVF